MSPLSLLQSVQFISAQGKRFAVIDAETWEAIIEWLENLEDLKILQQSAAELAISGGDYEKAGWLNWENVVNEIE